MTEENFGIVTEPEWAPSLVLCRLKDCPEPEVIRTRIMSQVAEATRAHSQKYHPRQPH